MTGNGERRRRAGSVMVTILVLTLAACGGRVSAGSSPPTSATGPSQADTTGAAATATGPTAGVPTKAPCPTGSITVSPLGEWRITGRDANISGRPEDDAVTWQTNGMVSNTTSQRVAVKSIVVVNITRSDASSFPVRSILAPAAERNEIGLSTGDGGDVVRAGESLSMLVTIRTRPGWPVATSDIYVQAAFELRKDCPVSVAGAKDYASAPAGLYPCGKNAASQCFR